MTAQRNRLPEGGRIDRSIPLSFSFNGRYLQGFRGDTLASALLANGVRIVGRSFKYHRPRGIIGCGAEEPNAIVQVGVGEHTIPNLRATQVELYEGLTARSVRGWPSAEFDLMAVNNWFSALLSAGFYYKTFMRPKRLWEQYEHFIRKASGLGTAPAEADPDVYLHRNIHCDILIVGAGPAGLTAALTAAKSGARVILVDEQPETGGSLLHSDALIDGVPASDWAHSVTRELLQFSEFKLLNRSSAFGYFDHNFVGVVESLTDHLDSQARGGARQRLWRIRTRQTILAQGAFERPMVFCNNDRPGVMQASAVSTYIKRYAVTPGQQAVVFVNNDSGYQAAIDLVQAGGKVNALVDVRPGGAGDLGDMATQLGIRIIRGAAVVDAAGRKAVSQARVMHLSEDGRQLTGTPMKIECDLIAMSGGWSPAIHLHSQAGGHSAWDEDLSCIVPQAAVQANVSVGACNGALALDACLHEGRRAGRNASQLCGFAAPAGSTPAAAQLATEPLQTLWRVPALKPANRCPKQFLDYQNDTSVADIQQAVREGYRNVEHVKRYTALGFGTDQGKLGNINGMAVLAEALQVPIAEVGTTTFRPAYTPISFGVCAGPDVGRLYEPVRKTAVHDWHEKTGAPMEIVGQWLRPWYFPKPQEDIHAAVARECLATRNSVGIMDASTLGKIDVQGPDATRFLERIYTHSISRLKPGRCAYGIMMSEDGMLMDDGVMARLEDQHYYLTTTTGGAANVLAWLESWLQTEWPHLDVYLTSLTDHWSTIAVAGPNSRKVLQSLDSDIDFSADAFPFMSVRSGMLANLPVQVFRVSFSGELAFEININSNDAMAMWSAVMQAGDAFDITPYGTETMHVLRAEKGFVIVGQDTDGSVTPVDLGMSWMLAKDKDYLGKRSLSREDTLRSNRKQWVGLLSKDGQTVLPEGCQLVDSPNAGTPKSMVGHVSSSYHSAFLGHPIALALVEGGRSRKGDTLFASLRDGQNVEVEIVSPVFYDPKSERQRV